MNESVCMPFKMMSELLAAFHLTWMVEMTNDFVETPLPSTGILGWGPLVWG